MPGPTGKLETLGDHDWFAVTLVANKSYLIKVNGLTQSGQLFIGSAAALANGVASSVPVFPGPVQAVFVHFTPTASGTYYIDVSDFAAPETYQVSAAVVADDYTDNPTRAGAVTVGGAAATGKLETLGDHDWFAVTLVANQSYLIKVNGLTQSGQLSIGGAAALAAWRRLLCARFSRTGASRLCSFHADRKRHLLH